MSNNQFELLGQRRFAGLFYTQFLGAFNDNVFKAALSLIFVYSGLVAAEATDVFVNAAAGLFILPFFLFSAVAGQIADKYEKSQLVRWIKIGEVVIALFGGLAVYSGNVYAMLAVLFLLGVQSAFFGPLKYSILPQHLAPEELIGGNAQIEMGTFVSMIGFSVPPFFSGVLVIVIFSVQLGWFPSIYDTTHKVTDWDSFVFQMKQMVMPVMVLALQITAQLSRFMRASMLDNLNQDYVRTARAKGLGEYVVVMVHVLRNSMIPVVTVIALGIPSIFGGAIITEQVFKVNGIGQLLIGAIQANDLPMVQTVTFMLAVLIVMFNIIADLLYGVLDPRIRYD